jgi:periplasmic protein TonB
MRTRTLRFFGAFAGASALTLGLIYWMQALIEASGAIKPNPPSIALVMPTLSPPPEPPRRPERVKELTTPADRPSIAPSIERADRLPMGMLVPAGSRSAPIGFPDTGTEGPWAADGDYLLLTRIQPSYPAKAISSNLEGSVVLEFTITARGTTADIVVVRSTHAAFERPAIAALERYRYEPRVVQGTPVAVPGARVEFIFDLDE